MCRPVYHFRLTRGLLLHRSLFYLFLPAATCTYPLLSGAPRRVWGAFCACPGPVAWLSAQITGPSAPSPQSFCASPHFGIVHLGRGCVVPYLHRSSCFDSPDSRRLIVSCPTSIALSCSRRVMPTCHVSASLSLSEVSCGTFCASSTPSSRLHAADSAHTNKRDRRPDCRQNRTRMCLASPQGHWLQRARRQCYKTARVRGTSRDYFSRLCGDLSRRRRLVACWFVLRQEGVLSRLHRGVYAAKLVHWSGESCISGRRTATVSGSGVVYISTRRTRGCARHDNGVRVPKGLGTCWTDMVLTALQWPCSLWV
ncbi:hypothetical protein EXIGLDRAFT_264980 [Exidia glandulosa HHB12029]|uniref:Uncharacterized protein n=1 Tax=Exidia glandulosa HHB12029 TaxID=1314781 RepID=A0A165DQK9_EXIGL|nr:hypothetical protein EXIGLDRAFT_264980 [Exidia glandulosa HHB12029]